uniref:Cytosolic II small heat shock protein HSP18.3II n=1 Tax=Funaria hygrometrica TaxID=29583 RepID=Q9ZSX7_FUNHY|nr:cytosolic II small heat shock protein HSP18.3II [Funaria hygrometrica]
MDFVVFDTDPFLTTLHQLVHEPGSDLERKIKRQRRNHHDEPRHVTIATPVDVKEIKDAYLFVADVPGLQKTDIEVQVENENVLTMRGKRKLDEKVNEKEEDTKFIRMERSPVKLLRKFTLPSDANADAITANCVDGVLTVTVPKIPPPEPAKSKTVQIAVD